MAQQIQSSLFQPFIPAKVKRILRKSQPQEKSVFLIKKKEKGVLQLISPMGHLGKRLKIDDSAVSSTVHLNSFLLFLLQC